MRERIGSIAKGKSGSVEEEEGFVWKLCWLQYSLISSRQTRESDRISEDPRKHRHASGMNHKSLLLYPRQRRVSTSGHPHELELDARIINSATMKVKIRKWNAVATWRWDIPDDDVCGICQVHFDGTCPTCKYPGDDCSLCRFLFLISHFHGTNHDIVSGKCGHNFHMVSRAAQFCIHAEGTDGWQHCIVEWIKQDSSKGQCPMCRQSMTLESWAMTSADWECRIRMGRQPN